MTKPWDVAHPEKVRQYRRAWYERNRERVRKAGDVWQHNNPVYGVYRAMLQRCFNPNNRSYKNYGGRGITVDPEWRSWPRFFADMGPRPEGLTLERIDNDGPYASWNCKWASRTVQNNNTRRNK